jgi:hypothetical protein
MKRSVKTENPADSKYYFGFDYLRAILSLMVVAWHMRLFGMSQIFNPNNFQNHEFMLSDIINFHFFLLAVPTFFLISLFLFSLRIEEKGFSYFKSRIMEIFLIVIFWAFFYHVFEGFDALPEITRSLPVFVSFILEGYAPVNYFFVSLIILYTILYFARNIETRTLVILFLISLSLLWIFPQSVITLNSSSIQMDQYLRTFTILAGFMSPFNFVPLVFASLILRDIIQNKTKLKNIDLVSLKKKLPYFVVILLVLFIIASVFEWIWMPNGNFFEFNGSGLPAYTRISVIIGGIILFLFSLSIDKKPGKTVQFMSRNSFGLFCIHNVSIPVVAKNFDILLNGMNIQPSPDVYSWISFLLVLAFSYVSIFILRSSLKRI